MFLSRADLFHIDHENIQYTAYINREMLDSLVLFTYSVIPYFFATAGVGALLYCVWEVVLFMDIHRLFMWGWYMLNTDKTNLIEIVSVLTAILLLGAIVYTGCTIIHEFEHNLEKIKNERLDLLSKIEFLERNNSDMKFIFKKINAFAQDDFKQIE